MRKQPPSAPGTPTLWGAWRQRVQARVQGIDGHVAMLLLIGIAVFVAMSLARPNTFPTRLNIASMASQLSEIGILTLGMVLAMLIGGIDLSVNATANLSAIFAAMVLRFYLPDAGAAGGALPFILLAFGVGWLTGALCGAANGLLIGYVRVPAILATLSTMTLFTGLAVGLTRGSTISGFPASVLAIGNGTLLGIPIPLLVLLALALVVWFLLTRTTYGFKVYMLGTNPVAAQFSGINNRRVILTTHILTGLLSASTGLLALARTNSANADYGSSYILLTLLIAVLGGVAVTGGFGRIAGVMLALVVLQFLSTGFNMLLVRFGGSNFFRDFAWGLLLLLVTSITAWRLRHGGRSERIKQRVGQGPTAT
jgi:simple sugar transport system permease protein